MRSTTFPSTGEFTGFQPSTVGTLICNLTSSGLNIFLAGRKLVEPEIFGCTHWMQKFPKHLLIMDGQPIPPPQSTPLSNQGLVRPYYGKLMVDKPLMLMVKTSHCSSGDAMIYPTTNSPYPNSNASWVFLDINIPNITGTKPHMMYIRHTLCI